MLTTGEKSESGPKTVRGSLRPDDPEQSKHFMEAAPKTEADEMEKGANRAFRRVARPAKSKATEK